MPGRYQAVSQNLGGVGGPQEPRYGVDVPGAIDAFTTGASSLIRAAYERKRQTQLDQQAAAQQELQNKHNQRELDLREQDQRDTQAWRLLQERHRFMEAGGISKPETNAVEDVKPSAMTAFNPAPSPVRAAMGGMPGVQVTPSNAPASTGPGDRVNANPAPAAQPTTAPTYHPESRVVETYDPTQGGKYVTRAAQDAALAARQDDKQAFDAVENEKRRTAKVTSDNAIIAGRKEVANINAAARTSAAKARGPIGTALTANAKSALFERIARGIIQTHNGDMNAALASLDTEQGKGFVADGFTPGYLIAAYGRWKADASTAALRLQSGALGMDPSAAVGAVTSTGSLVGGQPPAVPDTGVTGGSSTSAPRASAAPTPKMPYGPMKGTGPDSVLQQERQTTRVTRVNADTVPTPKATDVTDEEAMAAVEAGAKTEAEAIKWIHEQRNKANRAKKGTKK